MFIQIKQNNCDAIIKLKLELIHINVCDKLNIDIYAEPEDTLEDIVTNAINKLLPTAIINVKIKTSWIT